MNLSFETKEQYIQWRAEWRARYKQISRDIRDLRLARRAAQSGIENPKWDKTRKQIVETIKRYTNKTTGVFEWWKIEWLRDEARQMLELRAASKILAQEQYLKLRQQQAKASAV